MISRKTFWVWIAIVTLSGMFFLGQESWPSKPGISVVSPEAGELLTGTSLLIDIVFSDGDTETFAASLNGEEITSELVITENGASGTITTDEGSLLLSCSISNSAGTSTAKQYFHYSSTGFPANVSNLQETDYNAVFETYPKLQSLHDDLVELQATKGYSASALSRLKYETSNMILITTSIQEPVSESYDGMVHLLEMKVSPAIASGPLYWSWIWEWLSPTSFKWYTGGSSVTVDISDPENPVVTFDPPVDGSGMSANLIVGPAFTCFSGGGAAMGWLTCIGSLFGAIGTCGACVASGGANVWACIGCFGTSWAVIGTCGSCNLCTYPWCN